MIGTHTRRYLDHVSVKGEMNANHLVYPYFIWGNGRGIPFVKREHGDIYQMPNAASADLPLSDPYKTRPN